MAKTKQVVPTAQDYAVQSHQISRASYSMPVMQRRLVYLAMAQVRPTDDDLPMIEMTVGDAARALDVGVGGSQYEQVIAAVDGAMSRVLTIHGEDGWEKINWFRRVAYVKSRNVIKLQLHPDLKPYVLALQNAFAIIPIKDISRLQGRHALRLFELIMANQGMAGTGGNKPGCWYYDVEFDHLRFLLELAPHEYKDTKNFRVRVVDGPVREINEAGLGIRVTCDYDKHRHGRRLLGVRLNVQSLRPGDPRPVNPATQTEFDEDALIAANESRFAALLEEARKGPVLPFVTDPEFHFRQEALAKLQAEQAAIATPRRGRKPKA